MPAGGSANEPAVEQLTSDIANAHLNNDERHGSRHYVIIDANGFKKLDATAEVFKPANQICQAQLYVFDFSISGAS